MRYGFVTFALIAATGGAVAAQPVAGPRTVNGWTIAATPLGCKVFSATGTSSAEFQLKQDGTESWLYRVDDAINHIDVADAIVKLGRVPKEWASPVRWVEIDGRRFDRSALDDKGVIGRLANARSVVLHVEGYVNRASQAQLTARVTEETNARNAARAAGRAAPQSRFYIEDYRRETVNQQIPVPGPAATSALRACAAAPRPPNQTPELRQKRDTGPGSGLGGGSLGQIIGGGACRPGPRTAQMPTLEWMVAVDADGKIAGVEPTVATAAVARSEELRAVLRRTLVAKGPATDAAGRFTATKVTYRSGPTTVGCGG